MTKTAGSLLSEAAFYADGAKRLAIASHIRFGEVCTLKPNLAETIGEASLSSTDSAAGELVKRLSDYANHLQHLADVFGHNEVRRRFDSRRDKP